ncbi:hypothetical protein ABEW34_05905 [Paenibacillus algorifonticola]|uniref:hypothetical protein n=1 Tax=Paenibacillus algorifonticola TaxID=684063 RepID=UPI003D299C52
MNKKTVIILTSVLTLTLGGSAYAAIDTTKIFKQVDSRNTVVNDSNSNNATGIQKFSLVAQDEILAPALNDQSDNSRIDISNITEQIDIPLDLAGSKSSRSLASTSQTTDNSISQLVDIRAERTGHGDTVLAIYQLQDGKHEVLISQSTNAFGDEQAAIEDTKSWYNANDVKVIKLNGHHAVIENASNRKQVHLITDEKFYTVASPGTLNLDYLIELAKKINVE